MLFQAAPSASPGGLLSLQSEAELAALVNHELGHVNARHTAAIMSSYNISQMKLIKMLLFSFYQTLVYLVFGFFAKILFWSADFLQQSFYFKGLKKL